MKRTVSAFYAWQRSKTNCSKAYADMSETVLQEKKTDCSRALAPAMLQLRVRGAANLSIYIQSRSCLRCSQHLTENIVTH